MMFYRMRALWRLVFQPPAKPCPYCTGSARTGLPDNACENCMNTRVEH